MNFLYKLPFDTFYFAHPSTSSGRAGVEHSGRADSTVPFLY